MTSTDRSFEERLNQALAEPMSPTQACELDARLAPLLASTAPRSHRRRRAFRVSLLLAAALAVAVPLMALGGMFSTEDPFGLADAAEFQAELDAAMAAVPLPAGVEWPDHLRVEPDVSYSRGGARSWVESNAVCIWLGEWLDARTHGEADRERHAAAQVAAVRSWPSWDSPFWTQSVRDYLGPVLDAVAAGEMAPVEAEMATNCSWLAGS